ncbi:MAG: tetratricopeptide repeat protein [Deltaproteobacteria bacterium]|nr:tetratricopeptide repeat protein [Deltaproteobacteria bacterium]
MLRRSLLFWVSVVLLWCGPAWAQPSESDVATARQLAQEAQQALDAKDYAAAADRFKRAESLYHAPTLLLGLARAYVGLGKYVAAREAYNKVVREKLGPDASKPFREAVEAARTEVVGLDAKIAWVTIEVEGPTDPAVTLDAEAIPTASLGVRRAIDPGEHVVRASAPGYVAREQKLAVDAGGSQQVKLTLQPDPNANRPAAAPVATPGPDTGGGGGTLRLLGFVSLGVGGAGLIAGAVTGALAMDKHSELESACSNGICSPDEEATLDGYHTLGTISTVGFVAGGVLAAGGLALVLFAPSGAAPSASAELGPGRVQATVRF